MDTNKQFLVNKSGDPVSVDAVGQIPSRFFTDVTGFAGYRERQQKARDPRIKPDGQLAMRIDPPKSLTSVNKRRNPHYTPTPQKLYGYAQMPRQQALPYQNDSVFQKLLKRHVDKGQMLREFNFPLTQGKQLRTKAELTDNTFTKYCVNEAN